MDVERPGVEGGRSLCWGDGVVLATDQRARPGAHRTLRLATADQLIAAVHSFAIRGASAVGLAGALGVALSAHRHRTADGVDETAVRADAVRIAAAGPTTAHLTRAVRRVLARLPDGPDAVLAEALALLDEDAAVHRAAASRACDLVLSRVAGRPMRLLAHSGAGRPAAAAVGAPLGAVIELAGRNVVREVLVGEAGPLPGGAGHTAWELARAGVAHRLCADSAAAAAMAAGLVDCVVVGAELIAANGDVVNETGTYALAVAAARHGIPFVVVAPESSAVPAPADGPALAGEERDPASEECYRATVAGAPSAPPESGAYRPAFDRTPAELITAIVTERRTCWPQRRLPRRPRGPAAPDTGPRGGAPAPDSARRQLARYARTLYERGWMPGTAGNLSVRGRGDTLVITGSGRPKGELTERDMVAVRLDTGAEVGAGPVRASAETAIHRAVYRATRAGAVIHVHAPYATATATRVGHPERRRTLPVERLELLKGLGLADPSRTELPVFPNWPEVSAIARDVAGHLAGAVDPPPGLLIADHGITAWGRDLAQARDRLECLEAVCQLLLLTQDPALAAYHEGR
ncbi:methylthioribulose 1-phosphate dehydratase [Streptomyces sp. 796.1]|uniref:methylthioribulose 1-phosphate dehydratase n=1 Tax=Streptomyces sp. 796.1 TaxID=3163029 RepID=UPI0039C9DE68